MGIRWIIAALTLATTPVWAANYATCLLDKLPGTQNDSAASAIVSVCSSKHKGEVEQGSGRGFFGYDSGAECHAEKAKETPSNRAAYLMRWACNRLYDKPNFFDKFDESTAVPVK